MSIQTEIERLENAKSALKTSITNKGVTVDEGKKINEYSALVDSIVELKGQTKTVTPSTSKQTISPDAQYNGLTSVTVNAVTSAIDSNIVADNIKKDVSILGVTGTYAPEKEIDTSDATATANQILESATAYVNGQKITGTLPLFPNTSTFTVDNAGVTNNTEDSTLELTTINTLKQTLDSNLNMKFSAPYVDITTAIGLTADKIVSGNTILGVVGTAPIGTTPDTTIQNGEYGLETATSGEGDNDTGYKFYTDANIQSKLYETGSIVEIHITNELLAQVLGITADKIKAGETIAGVAGTYTGTTEAEG